MPDLVACESCMTSVDTVRWNRLPGRNQTGMPHFRGWEVELDDFSCYAIKDNGTFHAVDIF